VFATHTVIVSLAAGMAVALLASVIPAMRATRAAPIAAVREGATLPPTLRARQDPDRDRRRRRWRRPADTGLFASRLATSVRLLLLAA
jgi:hypothetical protein